MAGIRRVGNRDSLDSPLLIYGRRVLRYLTARLSDLDSTATANHDEDVGTKDAKYSDTDAHPRRQQHLKEGHQVKEIQSRSDFFGAT